MNLTDLPEEIPTRASPISLRRARCSCCISSKRLAAPALIGSSAPTSITSHFKASPPKTLWIT